MTPLPAPCGQAAALEGCLERGGVALFGADTVYGLCCDPLDAAAVQRLFALKGRPPSKPAALAFFSLAAALAALPELGPRTRAAFAALLPGPLTLLVPNPARRFPLAGGGDLLGVRVLEIGIDLARPVLQSSANHAGGRDPRTLDEVPAEIRAAADLVIDRGTLPGTPSTVVDLSTLETSGRWRIVRRGDFPASGIRRALLGSRTMADDLPPDYFARPLAEIDPEIAEAVAGELDRQQNTLELIASENFVPYAVLEAAGSVLTNKYAEGYPGARYYGGCEYVDVAEQLAIDRAKALFGAEHANVQPHAGAQANAAVYHALLEPGDTIMGLALAHGGHLTHGMKKNVSGRLYKIVPYEVDRETSLIDMDALAELAREHRPKLLLAGWSAYPRRLDFARFREIADEVGAYLMVDMAHFAGLVAAGLHPDPVAAGADVVTTTTHKTLGGPRGGLILCQERYAKEIDSAVFPGQQGGPLQHVIAAKAVALKIAATEAFRERQRRTIENAGAMAESLLDAGNGVRVLTGGTDVHLVLVDLRESELSGQDAEDRLHDVRITVNRNAIPFDPRPPRVTSGLRVGTPALTTRGLGRDDFFEIGEIIGVALGPQFDERRGELLERVAAIVERYPLYADLTPGAAAY